MSDDAANVGEFDLAAWVEGLPPAGRDVAATVNRGFAHDTVVVAAHPDDETIGAGVMLSRLGGRAMVVHVTDGAPRDGRDARQAGFETPLRYAEARRRELEAAMRLAGVGRLEVLGYADQQAAHHLVQGTLRLRELFAAVRPAVVVTQAYEGGHPDHDATAFMVSRALGTTQTYVEMTSYHLYRGQLRTGAFLLAAGVAEAVQHWRPGERELKEKMLACFATQRLTLEGIGAGPERFRIAPRYDFCAPANPEGAWYERFDWGMTVSRFTELAREADAALGVSEGGEAR